MLATRHFWLPIVPKSQPNKSPTHIQIYFSMHFLSVSYHEQVATDGCNRLAFLKCQREIGEFFF